VRRTAAEKLELIQLVEGSDLGVRRTLRELQLNRSTFYTWYARYRREGRAGLEPHPSVARRYWNRIPPRVRQRSSMRRWPIRSGPRGSSPGS
jgi:putative transposase